MKKSVVARLLPYQGGPSTKPGFAGRTVGGLPPTSEGRA